MCRFRTTAAAAVLCAALALTGCGGGSGTNTDNSAKEGSTGNLIAADNEERDEERDYRGEENEEEEETKRLSGFAVCSVFDISQTEGDEIPLSLSRILDCHVEDYQMFINALIMVSPVPVAFQERMHAYGCFYPLENRIEIRAGLPNAQTIKTMIHEIAHAVLHRHDRDSSRTARSRREIEAESVAYIVSTHYGIDTSSYSFGYIASWSKDKDLPALKSSLQTIQQAAAHLISLLDCVLYPQTAN